MNDCSHSKSLVPVGLLRQEYLCTKCGEHFKIIHIDTKGNLDSKKSLRASIPEGITKFLDLKASDKLQWQMDVIGNKRVVVVKKSKDETK